MNTNIDDVKVTEFLYKKAGGAVSAELKLLVYSPKNFTPPESGKGNDAGKTAVIFFFGGGWMNGSPKQFIPQSIYLVSKGYIAITPEYRIQSLHKTTPIDSVADAKDAVLWVRDHALELGVNPNRILVGGGSAGGHIAACTALLKQDEIDGREIYKIPKGLILFNPVLDTTEDGLSHLSSLLNNPEFGKFFKSSGIKISPLHHIRAGLPPTVIFNGEADTTTLPRIARDFQEKMKSDGNNCAVHFYPGENHGFFNIRDKGDANCLDSIQKAEKFISEIKF